MNKMFMIVWRLIMIFALMWLSCVLLVWLHARSRLNVDFVLDEVSSSLRVNRDKMLLLNEPRKHSPFLITECIAERDVLLDQCVPIVPPQEELTRLSAQDRRFVLETLQREYEQKLRWVSDKFRAYEVELKGDVKNLYTLKGAQLETRQEHPLSVVVVETVEHIYMVCHCGL